MTNSREQPGVYGTLEQLGQQLLAESDDGFALLHDVTANPLCALDVDDSIPCVTVVWKRYVTSTQLRFIHEHILQLLKQHGMNALLGDDTALPMIHAEDRQWIVESWMPRAHALGLKAVANKRSQSYFGRLAVDAVHAVAPSGIRFRSFDRLDDARQWLQAEAKRPAGAVESAGEPPLDPVLD